MAPVALDAAIVAMAALALIVVIFDRFDAGLFRLTSTSRPVLLLLLLVPIRLALGGDSRLSVAVSNLLSRARVAAGALPVSAAVRDVVVMLLVTRIAIWTVAFVANILIATDRPTLITDPFAWPRFIEIFALWDSAWYVEIATRGYSFRPDAQSSIAFFPLYPLLIRAVAAPFGGSQMCAWFAGMAIAWLAFAAALLNLHKLTEQLTGSRDAASRTVLYLAVFPFSFFYTAVYTEALFLLVTVCAVRGAYDGRWWQAGVFGALATLTRPNGILIGLPLLILALSGRPAVLELGRRLAWLTAVPLALVGYSLYVRELAGDPLAWLGNQSQWSYSIGHAPHQHLLTMYTAIEREGLYGALMQSGSAPIDFFYTLVALLFLALVPAVVRTFGLALGSYVLVSLLIPLSGNVLIGIGRYASVLFPVFMVAGLVKSSRAHEAILVVSSLLLALFVILFVLWQPVY